MTSSVGFDHDFLGVCCFSLLFRLFHNFFSGLPRHDRRNIFIEEVRAAKASREKKSISDNRTPFQMRGIRNSLRVTCKVVERTVCGGGSVPAMVVAVFDGNPKLV